MSRTSLWKSWKEVRRKLRDAAVRDVIDYVDYDVDPNKWINRLLKELRAGKYQPSQPLRFSLGKSKGFSRWMTFPYIADLVLFHSLATQVVERGKRRRRKLRHVYFMRDRISRVQKQAHAEAVAAMKAPTSYQTGFHVWLRFHQYRRYLIFEKVYPYIVVTDISNFFDSIVHDQIESCIAELGFHRNFTGLLLFLLERLAIQDSYGRAPRIGLPVDQFDCSRCLAHLMLFPHDDRMVRLVDEKAYVRWMDDQTIGVSSEAEALRVLAEVNASLRRMHLVPNAGKTRILTLSQARRHFHLDINDRLDKITDLVGSCGNLGDSTLRQARKQLQELWTRTRKHEGVGEWGKILKRFYLLAGRVGLRFLVRRTHRDVVDDPALAARVARYLRVVSSAQEFFRRTRTLLEDPHVVYEDAKRAFVEELLRLETTDNSVTREIRQIAREGLEHHDGAPAEIAPLLLLRFGDKRSLKTLARFIEQNPMAHASRAAACVLGVFGPKYAEVIQRVARQELAGPLRGVVRLLEAVGDFTTIPNRVSNRLRLRLDPIEGRKYLDTRVVLIAGIHATNPTLRPKLKQLASTRWGNSLSAFEAILIQRILRG